MSFEHIRLETRDNVALLTLNRPSFLNSLNVPLMTLEYERFCQRTLCDARDFMEGVSAFLEKRPAKFEGR